MSRGEFWRCDQCGNTEHSRMPDARVELQIVEGDVSEGIGPHTVKGDRRTKDFCNWRCAAIWCASRRGPWSLRIREVTEALDG